jgi:uncharacterized membrane protein HdeD (DUF308 family)
MTGVTTGSLIEMSRLWLQGRKTYLSGVAGILLALVAFADSQLNLYETAMAIYVGIQTMFIRSGVAKVETAVTEAVTTATIQRTVINVSGEPDLRA